MVCPSCRIKSATSFSDTVVRVCNQSRTHWSLLDLKSNSKSHPLPQLTYFSMWSDLVRLQGNRAVEALWCLYLESLLVLKRLSTHISYQDIPRFWCTFWWHSLPFCTTWCWAGNRNQEPGAKGVSVMKGRGVRMGPRPHACCLPDMSRARVDVPSTCTPGLTSLWDAKGADLKLLYWRLRTESLNSKIRIRFSKTALWTFAK